MTRLGQLHEQIISNSNDRDQTESDLAELFAIIESHARSLNDQQLSVIARMDQVEARLESKRQRVRYGLVAMVVICAATLSALSVFWYFSNQSAMYAKAWHTDDHYYVAAIRVTRGEIDYVVLHDIDRTNGKWRQSVGYWDGEFDLKTKRLTGKFVGEVNTIDSDFQHWRVTRSSDINPEL